MKETKTKPLLNSKNEFSAAASGSLLNQLDIRGVQRKQSHLQQLANRSQVNDKFSAIQRKADYSNGIGETEGMRDTKTGLPHQLKAGVESLSGYTLDDVKVHYNSSEPAQLQAHAFAQGNNIHVAPGQERHLPHETWHVVQQKQGRVQATTQLKSQAINDEPTLEHEADFMGVKALQFKLDSQIQDLNSKSISVRNAGHVAQRVIKDGEEQYPTTYKGIKNAGQQTKADKILDLVRDKIGGGVNEAKLITSYNKYAKQKDHVYDIETEEGKLVDLIYGSYQRRMDAMAAYQVRAGQAEELAAPLVEANEELQFRGGARNPMVVHRHPAHVEHDEKMSGRRRFATHAATLGMELHPSGEEFQGAARFDGRGLHLSSNKDATNQLIREQFRIAHDIKEAAAQFLEDRGIQQMSRMDAMADRAVRHVLKLFSRIEGYLAVDAPVQVPANVASGMDGMHAEIRIEQDAAYSTEHSELPAGTKFPCLACYIYFHGRKIILGKHVGGLWVTNPALSQQLKALLEGGITIGKMKKGIPEKIGKEIAATYANLPEEAIMALGKTRSGKPSYAHDADSDSDLDSVTYAQVQRAIKRRKAGKKEASKWLGMEHGWEPLDDHKQGHSSSSAASASSSQSGMMEEDVEQAASAPKSKKRKNSKKRKAIRDYVIMNGQRFATTHPDVRDGGQCLWDTLKVYGYTSRQLVQAAIKSGLTYNQSVGIEQINPLLRALGEVTESLISARISVFDILELTPEYTRYAGRRGGRVLEIGIGEDGTGQGHYVPTS